MPLSRDRASLIARPTLVRGAAITALAALATIAFTWPLAPRLGSVGRLDTSDGHWSIWCVAWVSHALATSPARLFDANIFHPHPGTLAYSENNVVAGLLGLPAYLATGNPYATHNLSVLIGVGLAFVAAGALARSLTRDTGAAIVAGLAFAFCPFMFPRLPHIQLLMFFGLPLVLLALHRVVEAPSPGRGVVLGLALVVQALACGYYGIFGALLAGFGLVFFGVTRRRWADPAYWIAGGLGAVTSIALVAPFFLPYFRVQSEQGFARSVEEAALYSADARAWLASSAWAHRWLLPWLGTWKEVLFPGLLTVAGGVWGAVRAWRAGRDAPAGVSRDVVAFYGAIAILGFWISFGPAAGLYRLLFATIPVFSLLRAPSRVGIVVVLALAVLLAIGLAQFFARLAPRRRHLGAGAAATLMAAELFTGPIPFRDAPPPDAVYRYLATAPRAAVLELPFFYERLDFPRHARYMSASGWHWQPLINGYSDHIPPEFRELAPRMHGFPSPESFAEMRRRGGRWVVVHLGLYSRRDRERLAERLDAYAPYLTLRASDGDARLYEITGWP